MLSRQPAYAPGSSFLPRGAIQTWRYGHFIPPRPPVVGTAAPFRAQYVRFSQSAVLRWLLLPGEWASPDCAGVLGNSFTGKHYVKWNVQRQDRIDSLMQTVHSATFLAQTEKAAVTI